MKKFFLVFISLALFAGNSVAQQYGYVPSAAELSRRMAYNDPYLYQKYKSASALSGFGAGLTIGGVAAIFIGIATADKETVKTGTSTQVNLSGPGAGVFAAGMVCTLAGTPIWIIGSTKKRNVRNTYLREYGYSYQAPAPPSPYLQLNTAQNGLALALVF